MNFKQFISGWFGRFTYSDLNAIFAELVKLRSGDDEIRQMLRKQSKPPRLWFFAEITGNTPIPNAANRWLYSWREVGWHANDWDFKPLLHQAPQGYGGAGGPVPGGGGDDPISSSEPQEINSTFNGDPYALAAVNGCEHRNQIGDGTPGNPNGIIGPGVDIDRPTYASCGVEVKPISNGVVVPMFTLHGVLASLQITGGRSPISYMFSLSNAHDKEAA